jgi:hypothetical protein
VTGDVATIAHEHGAKDDSYGRADEPNEEPGASNNRHVVGFHGSLRREDPCLNTEPSSETSQRQITDDVAERGRLVKGRDQAHCDGVHSGWRPDEFDVASSLLHDDDTRSYAWTERNNESD